MTSSSPPAASVLTRAVHLLLSALALGVFVWVCVLSYLGKFPQGEVLDHLYGRNPAGDAGRFPRLFDSLSYFTNWSTVMVAVASAAVAWTLGRRRTPPTLVRVLLLDALVMITVTAIVYAVILAPTENLTGISKVTNPLQHILIPALTVMVWLVFGPRGWLTGPGISKRTLFGGFLVVPGIWVAFALARGSAVGAYPYGFVDARTHGYVAVAIAVTLVLLFGLALGLLFRRVDSLLSRRQREVRQSSG